MSEPLPVLRNFVGGEYVSAVDGVTSVVVDPATEEAYARAPVSSAADVDAAMNGGFGHSGHGKDLSVYGFEEYTRVKHVMSYIGDTGPRRSTDERSDG